MNRTGQIVRPIFVAICAFIAGWYFPHSEPRKQNLLDQLRDMDRNQWFAFSDWRGGHPDIPRTIEFPEAASGPLWDYTLHAVLQGERRTWTWIWSGYTSNFVTTASAISFGTTSLAAYSTTCGLYPSKPVQYLFPTASGGPP